ncbi:MAG: ester cyclase [Prolixibacteraceae bacterium]|jgi:steroid delta-isomerase-like uncharacterized protein
MKNLFWTLFALILLAGTSCQDKQTTAELNELKSREKLEEQNKEIVREVISAIDENNFDKLNELFSNDFGLKVPGLEIPMKKDDVFQAIKTHYASFPDWTHNIEGMIAEGDKVVVKIMQIGTHKELYKGISATGKKITNPAIHIITIEDGKVKEWWGIEDDLGMMRQLGMVLKPMENKK